MPQRPFLHYAWRVRGERRGRLLRLALVQQRLGMVEEGNRTLSALVNEFEGVGELYRNYLLLSNERGIVRGPLYLQ